MNWNAIYGQYSNDVYLVVASFKVYLDFGPNDLKVDIFQDKNGSYFAEANYDLLLSGNSAPYSFGQSGSGIEDCLSRTLSAITSQIPTPNSYPKECIFWIKNNNNKCYIIDGNKKVVPLNEFNKRLMECKKNKSNKSNYNNKSSKDNSE